MGKTSSLIMTPAGENWGAGGAAGAGPCQALLGWLPLPA